MYEFMGVNLTAVLVAALASVALGFMWYGPLLGKTWMAEMKMKMPSKAPKGMWKYYTMAFLGSFVGAFVLAYFIGALNMSGWAGGATVGVWAWLGFFATTALSSVLWEGKSWRLYSVNVGYYLVNLLITGAILGAWM